MKLAAVLKLHRKLQDLTQKRLSELSDISIQCIEQIESGKHPTMRTLSKIFPVLGLELRVVKVDKKGLEYSDDVVLQA